MADDKRQTLDIPEGTTFEFRDGKLIFGHETDIVIRTNMGGYKFQKIFSKRGSVQVIPPPGVEFDVDEIEASSGDIFFNGKVRTRTARAKTIHFQDGALVGERFEATEEIVFGGGKLEILHAKAPRVVIDQDATGIVLVVECQNDPGRARTKGGFRSLEEVKNVVDRLLGRADSSKGSVAQVMPTPAAPAATAPTPAAAAPARAAVAVAEDFGDGTVLAARRPELAAASTSSTSSTQEFAVPAFPQGAEAGTQPALPKSSVFRKRT